MKIENLLPPVCPLHLPEIINQTELIENPSEKQI
jgi:hypothetical protein